MTSQLVPIIDLFYVTRRVSLRSATSTYTAGTQPAHWSTYRSAGSCMVACLWQFTSHDGRPRDHPRRGDQSTTCFLLHIICRGRTFSIYICTLSFWLTLPRGVMFKSWYCPSRPCIVFLAWVHLALFLALSLSPGNYLVSSWCDHNLLVSLLWQCLTVTSSLQLC